VRGGRYLALFRYGEKRYSYTKLGPFDVIQTTTEVSEITIVLHTYAGNANEEPSNEKEFNGQWASGIAALTTRWWAEILEEKG
jgi:hypothetical protein